LVKGKGKAGRGSVIGLVRALDLAIWPNVWAVVGFI
jgi:hypothetical protein